MAKKSSSKITKKEHKEDVAAIKHYEKYERESTIPVNENKIERLFANYEKCRKTTVDFELAVKINRYPRVKP